MGIFAAAKSIADAFGQAATHAPHPMHAAASMARSAWCFGIGWNWLRELNRSARRQIHPPARSIERVPIDHEIADEGKWFARNGSIYRGAVFKTPHVNLAGRARMIGGMRFAVDRQRASAADAFATILIKRDRLLAPGRQTLIHDVEHLQKRRIWGNVRRFVLDEFPFGLGTPDATLYADAGGGKVES